MDNTSLVPQNTVSGEVIDYDTLPPYDDADDYGIQPYNSLYKSRYSKDVKFESVIIRFGISRSRKFKSALKVLKEFPKMLRLSGDELGIKLTSCKQYFIYEKKIETLLLIIYSWKSTEILINGEVASSTDLRDFFWIFTERLHHFDKKDLLPPLKELDDIDFVDVDYIE